MGNLSSAGVEGQIQRAADQWEMTNKDSGRMQHISVFVCLCPIVLPPHSRPESAHNNLLAIQQCHVVFMVRCIVH